ncbi:hypothetical protein SDC9_80861 [bioreactor metagenome]|uniref:Uncharacterized protein n=1 Tax=bioreactor metagenome TaxID=1076179 RepID=A0A644Z148_9ZZZZ
MRRWDQPGLEAVRVGDPLDDHPGVAQVTVRPVRRPLVPDPQRAAQRCQGQPLRRQGTGLAEVLVALVEPAGRVVAVDQAAAVGGEGVRPAAGGRHHDIGVDPHPSGCPGQQREGQPGVAAQRADPVER